MVHRGYEERGCSSAGVLAVAGDASAFAATHIGAQARNYTNKVTIYTHANDQLATECKEKLVPSGFFVDNRKIARFELGKEAAEVVIHFDDGEQVTESFIVHRPLLKLRDEFASELGLEKDEPAVFKTKPPFNETSVAGVFVAGDAAVPFKISTLCLATGAIAAAGVQAQVNAMRHIVSV